MFSTKFYIPSAIKTQMNSVPGKKNQSWASLENNQDSDFSFFFGEN